MTKVVDFWLDLGVDGLRLDAVPYLYEQDGTNCENLPPTHTFLKKLRAHVDQKYQDRMLLAEANQWPEEAVAYFGQGRGDECHMAFHFPLMPRLFMAVRMEDRTPITDILEQTPPIPETSQWALFLRNHDELSLEMVTDEERDYMYRMYAHVQQARLNLGIRRRLAPLLGNDRKRIELLNGLLLSLPGTPVLYYRDEIGMGDNIYLGDRNGVRTPMQWSADRNAGFSRANPLTPGPHGFYWFSLEAPTATATETREGVPSPGVTLSVGRDWEELFSERLTPHLGKAIAAHLRAAEAFAKDGKALKGATLQDAVAVPLRSPESRVPIPASTMPGLRTQDSGLTKGLPS
jgi:glycosidase